MSVLLQAEKFPSIFKATVNARNRGEGGRQQNQIQFRDFCIRGVIEEGDTVVVYSPHKATNVVGLLSFFPPLMLSRRQGVQEEEEEENLECIPHPLTHTPFFPLGIYPPSQDSDIRDTRRGTARKRDGRKYFFTLQIN